MILEGWREAVWSGRYLGVRYDCASLSVARWINRLVKKVGLTGSDFTVAVQTTAAQIAALSSAATDDKPAIDEAKRQVNLRGHQTRRPGPHPCKPLHRGNRRKSYRPSHPGPAT